MRNEADAFHPTTYLKRHAITGELSNLQSKQMQVNKLKIKNEKMKLIAIVTVRVVVIKLNSKFSIFTWYVQRENNNDNNGYSKIRNDIKEKINN